MRTAGNPQGVLRGQLEWAEAGQAGASDLHDVGFWRGYRAALGWVQSELLPADVDPVVMCESPGCVLAADHAVGEHRDRRVSLLACPHNVPNFGAPCPICDR